MAAAWGVAARVAPGAATAAARRCRSSRHAQPRTVSARGWDAGRPRGLLLAARPLLTLLPASLCAACNPPTAVPRAHDLRPCRRAAAAGGYAPRGAPRRVAAAAAGVHRRRPRAEARVPRRPGRSARPLHRSRYMLLSLLFPRPPQPHLRAHPRCFTPGTNPTQHHYSQQRNAQPVPQASTATPTGAAPGHQPSRSRPKSWRAPSSSPGGASPTWEVRNPSYVHNLQLPLTLQPPARPA